MADWEKRHIVAAFLFELGHVERPPIKQAVVAHLGRIHPDLGAAVAQGLGLPAPGGGQVHSRTSPALSMTGQPRSVATRRSPS
ncbi:catalase-related domain-containing protein [[Actinomadura] parvosata]